MTVSPRGSRQARHSSTAPLGRRRAIMRGGRGRLPPTPGKGNLGCKMPYGSASKKSPLAAGLAIIAGQPSPVSGHARTESVPFWSRLRGGG